MLKTFYGWECCLCNYCGCADTILICPALPSTKPKITQPSGHTTWRYIHYNDVIMSALVSQITGVSIVCSSVGSCADKKKHQSSAALAFVWGIHRWPVNSLHKEPVTRKMFPFDDVIMWRHQYHVCPLGLKFWTCGIGCWNTRDGNFTKIYPLSHSRFRKLATFCGKTSF